MRISSINSYIKPNFSGIKSIESGIEKDFFGKEEKLFDSFSTAKSVDLWLFRKTTGIFYNPETKYTVLVSDNTNGQVLKEMHSDDTKEGINELKQRIEETLIWANAPANIVAGAKFANSEAAKTSPERVREIAQKLIAAQMSAEANTWQTRLDLI